MDAWYELSGQQLSESLQKTFEAIKDSESGRRDLLLRWLRMYSSRLSLSFSPSGYAVDTNSARSKWNVIRSCVDTAIAHIGTQRPRVKFLTSGGDWDAQRKARNLTKFLDGLWISTGTYKKTRMAAREAMIFGTGAIQVYREGSEIKMEPVCIEELHCDVLDSRYGKPRNLYRSKEFPLATLISMFPDSETELEESQSADNNIELESDNCQLVEAWHLPSSKGGDGRHVIIANGSVVIEDEEWVYSEFPIALFHWSEPVVGMWGTGIGEILEGLQVDINYLLRKIQNNLKMASTKVFVERGSEVITNHLARNADFEIISYVGQPPIVTPQAANSPESYGQLENLVAKAFELVGISQLAAQSKKPVGLNSGKALREYQDNQSQRFLDVQQAWQEFHVQIGRLCIMVAREIAEENPGFSVMAKAKNKLQEINWSDVNIEEADYIMQPWPVSILPNSPEGKLQTVSELLQMFPQLQDVAFNLLDFPDLEAMNDIVSANHNMMETIVYEIIENGNYIQPQPMFDLRFGVKYMTSAYIRAIQQQTPEDKLQMMRDWISLAISFTEEAEPQQPPQMPMPGMPPIPPGAPMQ